MHLFGDLDVFSFVRMRWLKWIGPINRVKHKRAASQVYNDDDDDYDDAPPPPREVN
jgi:hypothetical protein